MKTPEEPSSSCSTIGKVKFRPWWPDSNKTVSGEAGAIHMAMTHSFKEVIARHGYAFVNEYCPGASTPAVANSLGKALTPWEGGLVQDLVPRSFAPPNTYSGIYGLDRFPFHTDLAHWRTPPRYLLLRCLTGYQEVATHLIDGYSIVDTVTPDVLTRAIFKPRRPRNGELALLRLCAPTDEGFCFRWDEVFLRPASRIGDIAVGRVKEELRRCGQLSISLVKAGDTLLIDNWRMLHSRSPIPIEIEDRKIQRIYLEGLH